ncbi:MAG: preprotein translocase subunit SecE [Lachnospiraceae bacterium]|jgi:preprotein translocase subunit SecE|nr:preprotein translocase subunit SecE [Lachnospiraceae bacterium]
MAISGKKDKTQKKSFWKGVKAEFARITWPDRETIGKQTVTVVCASLILGAIIALLDFLFQMGIDFIVTL